MLNWKWWPVVFLAVGAYAADPATLERGKYLTEEVGKCQDCHTERGADGQLDQTKWMKGATLDFGPLKEVKGWHKTSPDLTGDSRLFKKWGYDNLVKFMTTGLAPSGKPAEPPMPAYKLKQEDAVAIVEYLKSLK